MQNNPYLRKEYMEKAIGCENNAFEIRQWANRNIFVHMFTMTPHMDFMKIERTAFQNAANMQQKKID